MMSMLLPRPPGSRETPVCSVVDGCLLVPTMTPGHRRPDAVASGRSHAASAVSRPVDGRWPVPAHADRTCGRLRSPHGQPHPDLHPHRRRRRDPARRHEHHPQDRPAAARRTPTSTRRTRTSAWRSPRAAWRTTWSRCSRRVQNDLFDVGADFCTPVVEDPEFPPAAHRAGLRRPARAAGATSTTRTCRSCGRSSSTAVRRARRCSTWPAPSYAAPSGRHGRRTRSTARR